MQCGVQIDSQFTLSVVFLNINSLVNKLSSLEYLLGSFRQKAHVIVLNETWLKAGEERFYGLTGYDAYHQPRTSRDSRGGGIAIYTATELKCGQSFGESTDEIQFLGISLPTLNMKVITFYRPPPLANINSFYSLLDSYLESHKNSIILGDSNVNLLDTSNLYVQQYQSVIQMNSYSCLNEVSSTLATRVTSNSSTLIDHAITDLELTYTPKLFILENHISDHKLLSLELSLPSPKIPTTVNTYKSTNFAAVSQKLSTLPHSGDDFDDFHNSLCGLVHEYTTTKTRYTKNSKHNQPWFNSELRALKRKLKLYYRLRAQYPLNTQFQNDYRHVRAALRSKVYQTKSKFYSDTFAETIGNPSKMWKLTNQLMTNNFNSKNCQKFTLDTPTQILDSEVDVANEFNRHFTSVSRNIKIGISPISDPWYFNPQLSSRLTLFPSTDNEIKLIISQLSTKSSPGFDRIPASLLKENVEFFSTYLCKVANNIFTSGKFPSSLKYTIVTPVYKKDSRSSSDNYRPISVTSVFSKVFEQLIKTRLLQHLHSNSLISPNQFGFLKTRSTTGAAATLVDKIVRSLNSKMRTSVLFLDLVKAFDCMDYGVLRRILINYGVGDLALDLLISFLTERSQSVKVNATLSSVLNTTDGLPQGSVLVILFLIYINDFLYLPLKGAPQLFCDDAALTYSAPDFESLKVVMAEDLVQIDNFFKSRFMLLNASKTKFITFSTRNSLTNGIFDEISFKGTTISQVTHHDFLGLTLDSKLNFNHHIAKVLLRTSSFVGMLRRLRSILPKTMLWQIYYAHIHSHLTYLLPVWSSASQERLMSLQRVQNKAVKSILNLPYLTSSVSLYSTKFLPFTKLTIYESILFIVKIVRGLVTVGQTLGANLAISNRATRQSQTLRPPNYILGLAQNSAFYRGINLYNTYLTSPQFNNSLSISLLKTRLKDYAYTL